MKNKFDNNNIPTIKQSCNEWCCPCNEGKGCQANESCSDAGDNAFYNRSDKLNDLMNKICEAYMERDFETYDIIAKEMYDYALTTF